MNEELLPLLDSSSVCNMCSNMLQPVIKNNH